MKRIFLFLGAMTFLSSCSPLKFQVYTVTPTTPEILSNNNELSFENEDCKVSYRFWKLYGDASFVVYNKTDKDLVLDLNKCFFIKNGQAFDYLNYNDRIHPISVIPPKTFKVIATKGIIETSFSTCNFPFKITGKIETREISFTPDNTPLSFNNIITYTIDNKEKRINNNFYISKIGNYRQGEVITSVREEVCGRKGVYKEVFKDAAANKFFYLEKNMKPVATANLIGVLIEEIDKLK